MFWKPVTLHVIVQTSSCALVTRVIALINGFLKHLRSCGLVDTVWSYGHYTTTCQISEWPPKPLQCLMLMWCAKRTTKTRGNYTWLWWGQTKYKPLATNRLFGHVIWTSGCGDIAISNQQYHCNSFAPFPRTSGIVLKSHDIWLCLVIKTKIHIQILCLSLK